MIDTAHFWGAKSGVLRSPQLPESLPTHTAFQAPSPEVRGLFPCSHLGLRVCSRLALALEVRPAGSGPWTGRATTPIQLNTQHAVIWGPGSCSMDSTVQTGPRCLGASSTASLCLYPLCSHLLKGCVPSRCLAPELPATQHHRREHELRPAWSQALCRAYLGPILASPPQLLWPGARCMASKDMPGAGATARG